MKKIIITFFVFLFFTSYSFSQSIEIKGKKIEDINGKSLTFDFVKTYLKKDIAQQELKRFSITCEKIKIRGVIIQK